VLILHRSFLNDLDRVTSLKYLPSDGTFQTTSTRNHVYDYNSDDVLKARLKTVGVTEHRFEMETAAGRESGTEWRIVDVGGSRSQVRTSKRSPSHTHSYLTHVHVLIIFSDVSRSI
jgi:guanine nucleotide-binding protein subunit alpha